MNRPTGPACGNNPNHRLTDGDRRAVENFKAYLQQRADGRGPETARALLYQRGLPEDVIDGALCLHAQELAAAIREETRQLKAHGVLEPDKYRPCRDAANQIDPTRNEDDVDPDEAAVPLPSVDRAAHRDRIAEAALHAVESALGDTLVPAAREEALAGIVAALPESAPTTAEWLSLGRETDRLRKDWVEMRDRAERVEAEVQRLRADRAAVLREAADLAESLRQFEPATGARAAAQVSENVGILRVVAELRRLADETPAAPPQRDETLPAGATPMTVYLATPCDACGHTLNWHRNDVGCTVPRCVCGRFQEPAAGARQDGAHP